jgi:hypothetical protein
VSHIEKFKVGVLSWLYKLFKLEETVPVSYFRDMALSFIDKKRLQDAAVLVVEFDLEISDKVVEDLIVELFNAKQDGGKLLGKFPSLRHNVIKRLAMIQPTMKVAAKLIKKYKLSFDDFPDLVYNLEANSAHYYISRLFRPEKHEDHMPLHSVEDLFTGKHNMLFDLVKQLLKKKQDHKAKGVWNRHRLMDHKPRPQIVEAI